MNKLKKILLSSLAVCAIGCTAAGLAACDDTTDYPNYRRPASYVEPENPSEGEEFTGNYRVSVTSYGGTQLSGVKVDVMLNGAVVASTISLDGMITFTLEPNEYELVVDETSLPAGYFVDSATFKTSATSGTADIRINSRVQSTTAVSTYRYALGDVMYDFSYTDSDGNRQTLSEILSDGSDYKAVVLNFWYIDCNPCRAEFPYIQTAYEAYKDKLKFLAFDKDDSLSAINDFRSTNNYTFDMVQDVGGTLSTLFSVTANPTTIVIDRYGVYSYRDTGSLPDSRAWVSLFAQFTSDDYEQKPQQPGDPGDGGDDPTPPAERVIPDIAEDNYDNFLTAINGDGADGKVVEYYGATTENDKTYNWPWLLHTDEATGIPYVSTTNASYGNSFSIMTVKINLESGDFLSYEYFTSTEVAATGGDVLYVIIDGERVADYSGISAEDERSDEYGWIKERAIYIASRNRTIEISFCYLKDELENAGTDEVGIRNITIENVATATEAIDAVTDTAIGELNEEQNRYSQYITPVFNEDDGYYHVKYDDGRDSILFIDMLEPALFAELHIGASTFVPHNYAAAQTASLYFLIYWDYTNANTASASNGSLQLTFGGSAAASLTSTFIDAYYTAAFSPTGLIPVTPELRTMAILFTQEYCDKENIEYYEEMWLEFCRYYKHYGPEHTGDDVCLAENDPIPGMNFNNAYTATTGKNQANVWNISTNNGGGVLFKYVPETTGVYRIYSKANDLGDDPDATVYNSSYKSIASFDNLVSYDMFLRDNLSDFDGYVELTAGETYYLRITKGLQTTGLVDFYIEYVGESYDFLRVATTGDGMWSYNPSLGINFAYYLAVSVTHNDIDGYYYAVDRNNEMGSVIYIDFIHPNFYEQNDHSLLWIIENGYFDFSSSYGPDYTSIMMQYYYKSIEGKDEDDQFYGLLEASDDLVNYLCLFMNSVSNESDSFESGFWLSLACYVEHYGV